MIKFHCINKTLKIYEPTKLTIRLRDGGKKDYSYTTSIMIVPALFDFKGQGYPLKETKNDPEKLKVNNTINEVIELMKENYLETKDLNLSNRDFKKLLDKEILKKQQSQNKLNSDFAEEFEKYIKNLYTTDERREAFVCVANTFRRFQYYRLAFEPKKSQSFRFRDINAELLEEFRTYLQNEYIYYHKYPEFFKPICKKKIAFRKKNRIVDIFKKISSFSNKYIELYRLDHNPFHGFEIGKAVYEDPILLLDEEYEYIQNNMVDDPELSVIQKMFLLHTFFGVRYVDFFNAKKSDIVNDCLIAYPKKTIEDIRKVIIPLNDFGAEIIGDFYSETQDTIYLVPRYTLDEYNNKLKELFKVMGLDRIITRFDEEKGVAVHKPLYEVVSSHMARRTFINTLINEGFDNLAIKNMAGMSENSHEIARYYAINKKYRQECANSLDKRKVSSTTPVYQIQPFQKVLPAYQNSIV